VVDANDPVRALMPLNCGQCRDYFCKPNMTHKDRTGWLTMQSGANSSPHQIPC
jgi:hypothetical protein